MNRALTAMERLGRHPRFRQNGWIPTAAIADELGASIQEAAAVLRAAARRGLCMRRRSKREPTTWKLTQEGHRSVAQAATGLGDEATQG